MDFEQVKLGMLVQLRSGGPPMVVADVEHIEREGNRHVMLRCHWQQLDGTPHTMLYPPHCLKAAETYLVGKVA